MMVPLVVFGKNEIIFRSWCQFDGYLIKYKKPERVVACFLPYIRSLGFSSSLS